MSQLLIVYHSQSGSCARIAQAALAGAKAEEGVDVICRRAWDASVADVTAADGLLLVAAENSAALCGSMKDFLDRIFYPAIELKLVKPYALLCSAGNDGRQALRQAERILSGIPFPVASEARIMRGPVDARYLQQAEEVGQALAAGLAMGIF